jgi:RNA polymerase sigma-70 factor (ECF subfamily)
VRNKALDHGRRERSALRYLEAVHAGGARFAPSPEVARAGRGLIADLDRAIESLPPRYRQAFLLCVVEGLTYANTAVIMGISEHTVRQLVRRARCNLRAALAEHAGGAGRASIAGPG